MKITTKLLSFAAAVTLGWSAHAQVFFTENFEGAMTPATDLPAFWTETGLSTDGIWSTGDETAAPGPYIAVPAPLQGTNFAYTNDDACNCDKSADRMILPVQDFNVFAGVNLIFDAYVPATYGGSGNVEVSTDGGTTWSVVAAIPTGAAWQNDVTVSLNAYAGNTNVLVSFLYNDGGAWADAMAIDDVRLEEIASGIDMAMSAVDVYEYTLVPLSQVTPVALSGDVENLGTLAVTDATLTVNVYNASNLTTPIQTTNSGGPTIVAAGATVNLAAGTFTPAVEATYLLEFITTATGDADATNDTLTYAFAVTGDEYARDDANIVFAAGIGAGPVGYLGSMFDIVAPTSVDSVLAAFDKPGTSNVLGDGVGDSTRYVIFDVSAGLPNAIIGESEAYTFTAADTTGLIVRTLEIQATGGGALNLAPGTYFFAVEENNTNVGLAFTDDNFRLATHYFSWTGQAWTPAENFPAQFQRVPVIRPILGCALTATAVSTDATCAASDGSATITPSGVAPYTVSWSTGDTTTTIVGVSAGTYTYTITDGVGCMYMDSVVVAATSTAITATSTTTNASCGNADGTATVNPTNGTAPYTYVWSSGDTTATATGLSAGSYDVTVTDINGCTGIINVSITDAGAPSVSATSIDVSCNGGSDGSIDLTATGGVAPYTYSWSNGATTEDLTGLSAGSYTGTVTDSNGCIAVGGPIVIAEPDSIAASATTVDISASGATDGSIDLTVTGGTPSYTFSWDNGATTEDISGLAAGTYEVTITDSNGCTQTLSVEIMDNFVSLASINAGIGALNLFPNPANEHVTLELELVKASDVKVEVTNLNGQVLNTQVMGDVSEAQFKLNVQDWARGVYLVKIETQTGTEIVRFVKQ